MARCCVVIPTYREADSMAALLPQVFAQQAALAAVELWVVVVDDDPAPEERAVWSELQDGYPRLRVLHGAKRGLGIAYQRGFDYALDTLAPDWVMQMDGDGQHDAAMIPALVRACQAPVRAVIGSRFAPGGTTPSFSARRRWASLGGNWLLYRGLGGGAGLPRLADYTSGFRCLEAQALRECLPACRGEGAGGRGYAFQSSLIAAFMLAGQEVAEIPIAFGQRRHGHSKLTARDCWEFVLNVRRLRRRRKAWANSASASG